MYPRDDVSLPGILLSQEDVVPEVPSELHEWVIPRSSRNECPQLNKCQLTAAGASPAIAARDVKQRRWVVAS